jgi:anti-anti-sigma factor
MFHVYEQGGVNIIEVATDLDIASSGALASAIELAANMPYPRSIVNLVDCQFCDSTGLSVLVRAKRRLGDRLAIVGPSRSAGRRAFDVTELTEALALCATLEEALTIPPKSTIIESTQPDQRIA